MASTRYEPIADSYAYESIFKLVFQSSKTSASSDAAALGCCPRFNLSTVDQPDLIDDYRSQGPHTVGQLLSSSCTADLSDNRETYDSDNDGLPLPRRITTPLKHVINLTLDDDNNDGDDDDDDVTKVS